MSYLKLLVSGILSLSAFAVASVIGQPSYTAVKVFPYARFEPTNLKRDMRFVDFNARGDILTYHTRADSLAVFLYRDGQGIMIRSQDSTFALTKGSFARLSDNGLVLADARQRVAPFEEIGVVFNPVDSTFTLLSNRPQGQTTCPFWDDARASINALGEVFAELREDIGGSCFRRYGVWPSGQTFPGSVFPPDTLNGYPVVYIDNELDGIDRFNVRRELLLRGRGNGECQSCTNKPHSLPYLFNLDTKTLTPLPAVDGLWTGSLYNHSTVYGITNTGWAYGSSTATVSGQAGTRATVWQNGSPILVDDVPGTLSSLVWGMSDDGLALVKRQRAVDSVYEVSIWDGVTSYPLSDLIVADTFLDGSPVPTFVDRNDMRLRMNSQGDILVIDYVTWQDGTRFAAQNDTMIILKLNAVTKPLIVNSTGDAPDENPGDGKCSTGGFVNGEEECTLRAAIMEANAGNGLDTITFSIPDGEPPVIAPVSPLPAITAPVVLEGQSQPGADYVEIDGSGLPATAGDGVVVKADSTVIRGLAVYGFPGSGIRIDSADNCQLMANRFGLPANGDSTKGNEAFGVDLYKADSTQIGNFSFADENVIAFNGSAGIIVRSGVGNNIQRNAIYRNGGLGIDLSPLGVNVNDSLDLDDGANRGQNYPVIDSVITDGIGSTAYGFLNSEPRSSYLIEFFVSDTCDESGYGEGKESVWSTAVFTDDSGYVAFATPLSTRLSETQSLSATATGPDGSTSEFSRATCGDTLRYLEFRNRNDILIKGRWLKLYRVTSGPPTWDTVLVGGFKTDDLGRIRITDSLFKQDDTIYAYMYLGTERADRHISTLGTKFSIHLDNAKFDSLGIMSYDVWKRDTLQVITMDHSTFAYNLLVSVEWEIDLQYLGWLQDGFRAMANAIYDVTDGQMRIDTVLILDNQGGWDEADIRFFVSNAVWPHNAGQRAGGMNRPAGLFNGGPIEFPRVSAASPEAIVQISVNPIRGHFLAAEHAMTLGHELFHYAFGMLDEYRSTLMIIRENSEYCAVMQGRSYGFMDQHLPSWLPYNSELSSMFTYVDPSCRDNAQFHYNGQSCWGMLEDLLQRTYNGVAVPVVTPEERKLPAGKDYLLGPNDVTQELVFDVGKLIVFPNTPKPTTATRKLVTVTDSGNRPIAGIKVIQRRSGVFAREQGITFADGKLLALGIQPGDRLSAYGDINGNLLGGGNRSSDLVQNSSTLAVGNVGPVWMNGELTDSVALSRDSIPLELKAAQGNPGVNPQCAIVSNRLEVTLVAEWPFPTPPIVEHFRDSRLLATIQTTNQGNAYSATLDLDSLQTVGNLLVHTVDSVNSAYFFPIDYSVYRPDSGMVTNIIVPDGTVEISVNNNDGRLSNLILLRTTYPTMTGGLSDINLHVGQYVVVSTTGIVDSSTHMNLTIQYSDMALDAMTTGHNREIIENSIMMFHWSDAGQEWQPLASGLDSSRNIVSASIPEAGLYALFTTAVPTDVGDSGDDTPLPRTFALGQNYPNPFNPSTTIEYSLPRRSRVVIEVFNVLGRNVRRLVDAQAEAGRHQVVWDGRNDAGRPVASGVYLYRLVAGDYTATRKMLLLK